MYYLFALNDLDMGKKVVSYEEILDTLLKNSEWIFANTKNFRSDKFIEDDKIILYGAEKGRRCFVGTFDINR